MVVEIYNFLSPPLFSLHTVDNEFCIVDRDDDMDDEFCIVFGNNDIEDELPADPPPLVSISENSTRSTGATPPASQQSNTGSS